MGETGCAAWTGEVSPPHVTKGGIASLFMIGQVQMVGVDPVMA